LATLRSRQRQENLERFRDEQREHLEAGLKLIEQAFACFDGARAVWEKASGQGFQLIGVQMIWTRDTVRGIKAALDPPAVPSTKAWVAPSGYRQPLPYAVQGGSLPSDAGYPRGAVAPSPPAPPRPHGRQLYADPPPQKGEKQVVVLRGGYTTADNRVCTIGDKVNLPSEIALEAAARCRRAGARGCVMDSPRLVQTGTVGATAIMTDVRFLYPALPVRVQLTQPYAIIRPPGYPARPSMTGVAAINLDSPRTIASGTTIALLKPEADALIVAGGGTYV
jgi:hypothetical protein